MAVYCDNEYANSITPAHERTTICPNPRRSSARYYLPTLSLHSHAQTEIEKGYLAIARLAERIRDVNTSSSVKTKRSYRIQQQPAIFVGTNMGVCERRYCSCNRYLPGRLVHCTSEKKAHINGDRIFCMFQKPWAPSPSPRHPCLACHHIEAK